MEFHVKKVTSIVWPVTAHVPQDGGKTIKHEFVAKFELLSDDEYEQLFTQGGDMSVLPQIVSAIGSDNDHLTSDKQVLNDCFTLPYYRSGFFRAYEDFRIGAFEKN